MRNAEWRVEEWKRLKDQETKRQKVKGAKVGSGEERPERAET